METYTLSEYTSCVSPLNKVEWFFPLEHSQRMLDSVVGCWPQGQRKINIPFGVFKQEKKRNLCEPDSENAQGPSKPLQRSFSRESRDCANLNLEDINIYNIWNHLTFRKTDKLTLFCNLYLPTPPLGQDMTRDQFLSGV